jgi:hypothetical protein
MLSIHLRLGLPSGLFPSGFPTNNLWGKSWDIIVTVAKELSLSYAWLEPRLHICKKPVLNIGLNINYYGKYLYCSSFKIQRNCVEIVTTLSAMDFLFQLPEVLFQPKSYKLSSLKVF